MHTYGYLFSCVFRGGENPSVYKQKGCHFSISLNFGISPRISWLGAEDGKNAENRTTTTLVNFKKLYLVIAASVRTDSGIYISKGGIIVPENITTGVENLLFTQNSNLCNAIR